MLIEKKSDKNNRNIYNNQGREEKRKAMPVKSIPKELINKPSQTSNNNNSQDSSSRKNDDK